ncbi:MAG: translation initiation factor IF-2 [Patescibacteria group bacterium]
MKRPPVVVVVGHVDHGKTSLLDYIRKTNVASKEAGGITQSVGAYEISHNNERITFIDTPGHQVFTKMRARGVKMADIAILAVAADDSVQEQTKEAYKVLLETKTPFVVAITKIDKNNADINKTKNDLMQLGILLEGYGGNISWQEISSKTGEGIDKLLDLILLTAELENLQYDPENSGRGYVLESKLDSKKGILTTLIIMDGKIRVGDQAMAGNISGKIRSLDNFLGKPIKEAEPSSPILLIGFKEIVPVGSELKIGSVTQEPNQKPEKVPMSPVKSKDGEIVINLILKADSAGSLEALTEVMNNLPLAPSHRINILNAGIGEITEGDIKFNPEVIIGFRVSTNKAVDNLANIHSIKIISSEIIYELIKNLEDWIKVFDKKIISGDFEVLAVFGKKGPKKQIIGGKVIAGEINNNASCDIQRQGKSLGLGRIINLQKNKQDTNRVEMGSECGLLLSSEVEIKVGDHFIFN